MESKKAAGNRVSKIEAKLSKTRANTGFFRDFLTPKYSTPRARFPALKQAENEVQNGLKMPVIAVFARRSRTLSAVTASGAFSRLKKTLQNAVSATKRPWPAPI
jgi:hypothetical protein